MLSKRFTVPLLSVALVATGSLSAQAQIYLPEATNFGSIQELLRAGTPDVSAPTVRQEENLLYVESFTPDSLSHLYLQVSTRKGQVVYSERIEAVTTSLDLDGLGLPDGSYHYKVSASYLPESRAGLPLGMDRVNKSSTGVFTISQGLTKTPREILEKEVPSRQDAAVTPEPSLPVRMAGWLLDLVVAQASADTFTSDLEIDTASPSIRFNDTNDGAGNTNEEPWEFSIDWNAVNSGVDGEGTGYFKIEEWFDSSNAPQEVFRIDYDEAISTGLLDESIHIYENGDIQMVDGNFSVLRDGSFSATSLGQVRATDSSSIFAMWSEDTSDTYDDIVTILYSWYGSDTVDPGFGVNFNLFGPTPFFVEYPAPTDSLRINNTGTVSLAAGGKIHVGSDVDPVGQFTITSDVQPRFEMNDTTTGKRWRFSVASDKFAINNLDETGTEFQVFDNGNVLIGGALTENSDVNSKQDIVPVDSNDLLDRITKLPIAEWSYIDAPNERHIGPMAQDFHAAFGLGRGEKSIATLDTSGVALAGIKALKAENDRISAENQALRNELNEQKARLAALEDSQVEIMATLSTLTAEEQKPLFVVAATN